MPDNLDYPGWARDTQFKPLFTKLVQIIRVTYNPNFKDGEDVIEFLNSIKTGLARGTFTVLPSEVLKRSRLEVLIEDLLAIISRFGRNLNEEVKQFLQTVAVCIYPFSLRLNPGGLEA